VRSTSTVSIALIAVLAAAVARGGGPRDRGEQLLDAYVRGDYAKIAAMGRAMASLGLSRWFGGKSVARVRAAIAAAPHAEDAWQLLDDLARLAHSPDRQLSPAASRSAAKIVRDLDADRVAQQEIAPGLLREQARAWASIAARKSHWADVRVHAIEVNYLLTQTLAPTERRSASVDLVALTEDPEPEVRRAALELSPQPLAEAARTRAAEVVRTDADPVVAIVAGQVLCGGLVVGDDDAPLLSALAASGLERLRDLVGNAKLPIAARLEAAECLAANATAPDRAAIKRLQSTAPRYASERVRRLARKAARR